MEPLFIRIPQNGDRDPVFSLTRAFWYRLESAGKIRFRRIKEKGAKTGITLIPVSEARDVLEKLSR